MQAIGFALFLGMVLMSMTNCVPNIKGETVDQTPAMLPDYPQYNLVLVRIQEEMEITANLVPDEEQSTSAESLLAELNLSLDEIVQTAFLDEFETYPHNSVPFFTFLNEEDVGIVHTLNYTDESELEGIVREGEIQLTPYAQERMKEVDIAGAFVIDVKRNSIEYNHLKKAGRFFTFTIVGGVLVFGPVLWATSDYDYSVSVEFAYINQDNNLLWKTVDPYADLAGNKVLKSMPHGINFTDIKKADLYSLETIQEKLQTVYSQYTALSLPTFFGDAQAIPRFKGGEVLN